MKIELKNIRHSEALSEETNAFTASLYINGIKVGIAKNRGYGGPTDYQAFDEEGRKLVKEAEVYCKSLPPYVNPDILKEDGKPLEFKMDLELFIDNLLEDHLRRKDLKRLEAIIKKKEANSVLFGVPGTADCRYLQFKAPISDMLNKPDGTKALAECIERKILPNMLEGYKILNHNIPEEVFQKAGLKENQYFLAEPKIELRNIKYHEEQSADRLAFEADLYIDGRKTGNYLSWGRNGKSEFHADDDKGVQLFRYAERYCRQLPDASTEGIYGNIGPESEPIDLELILSKLASRQVKQQHSKKKAPARKTPRKR